MRLARVQRRPKRRLGETTIPLINVVFLLLVFVMITMSIVPPSTVEIHLPEAAYGVAPEESPLVLRVAADGRLATAGEVLERDAVLGRIRVQESPAVLLEADRRLPARDVLVLARALRDAGASRVDIALVRR